MELGRCKYHLSFCSHGDSLLDPGVAAEQREHEASDIPSPHTTAFGVTIAVGHKVSLVGEKLLRCETEVYHDSCCMKSIFKKWDSPTIQDEVT